MAVSSNAPPGTPPHHNAYLNLFFFNVFFACVSFSIIMPSLSPYLTRCGSSSPQYLAEVIAIYSIGEMLGSLLFGYLYNIAVRRSRTLGPKYVLNLVILTGVVGSFLYIAADVFHMPQLAFWGRFLEGLWTGGQQSVEQAYLAFAALPGERTELTSRLGTFAVLGFILGPAFGALFTSLDVTILGLHLDAYTAPGVFIIFASSAMLVMTHFTFHPSAVSGRDVSAAKAGIAVDAGESKAAAQSKKPSTAGVCVLLVMFFVHFYSFAVQETITTPLVLNLYDFEQYQVNLLFVAVGVLSLLTSTAVGYLSRVFSDRTILVMSILLGLIGSVILIDSADHFLDLSRFFIGFAIITVAFPMGRNVTISIFSAVLGNVEQGFYMGLMLAVGALPRALGPFWAIKSLQVSPSDPDPNPRNALRELPDRRLLYACNTHSLTLASLVQLAVDERGHYHTYIEFQTASAMFVLGLVLTAVYYKTLVPFEEYHGIAVEGGEATEEDVEKSFSEASPLIEGGKTPTKLLKERRNSIRPALVAQIQGEFPSSNDLMGSFKEASKWGK